MDDKQSWDSWREHVLAEIKRTNENSETLTESLFLLRVELAQLQVKAGIWGLLGGLIPVAVMIAVYRLK